MLALSLRTPNQTWTRKQGQSLSRQAGRATMENKSIDHFSQPRLIEVLIYELINISTFDIVNRTVKISHHHHRPSSCTSADTSYNAIQGRSHLRLNLFRILPRSQCNTIYWSPLRHHYPLLQNLNRDSRTQDCFLYCCLHYLHLGLVPHPSYAVRIPLYPASILPIMESSLMALILLCPFSAAHNNISSCLSNFILPLFCYWIIQTDSFHPNLQFLLSCFFLTRTLFFCLKFFAYFMIWFLMRVIYIWEAVLNLLTFMPNFYK